MDEEPPFLFTPSGQAVAHLGPYESCWTGLKKASLQSNSLVRLLKSTAVKSGSGGADTHVAMNGGRFNIPADREAEFHQAYAEVLSSNLFEIFMVEQIDTVFRAFVDLDFKRQQATMTCNDMYSVAEAVQDAVRAFFPSRAADQDFLRMLVCTTDTCKLLQPKADGEPAVWKTGVHLLFPNIFITGQEAMDMRAGIVKHCKCAYAEMALDWEDIVDASVYPKGDKKGSALRMIGSQKTDPCPDCKGCMKECLTCAGAGRVHGGRPYKLLCVLNPSGARDLDAEGEYTRSYLKLVQDSKIRTAAGTAVSVGYALPSGATKWMPLVKQSQSKKRKAEAEAEAADDVSEAEHELLRAIIRSSAPQYAEVTLDFKDVKALSSSTFSAHVMGSRYCHTAKHEHASNRIYFVVRRGDVRQYCHDDACKEFTTLVADEALMEQLFPASSSSQSGSGLSTMNDAYAAAEFVRLMGDRIQRDGTTVYVFNDRIGMWDSSDAALRDAASQFSRELSAESDKGKILYDYAGSETQVARMLKWVPRDSILLDSSFMERKADTSYGKLLFSDGIFDFTTGVFTLGFDPNIVFFRRINRPFAGAVRNEEDVAALRKMLFVAAFPGNEAAGIYLLQALAIGMIGDYERKKFYQAVGPSNCGKGLLVAAFQAAFEGYVDTFDANNLLYNPNNGQDEAKRNAWVLDLHGVRVAFSSEMRMTPGKPSVMCGNGIKSRASGGDTMKARRNYQDQGSFINRATLCMLANDLPEVTPNDDGVRNRRRVLRYTAHFVDHEPTRSDQRRADPDAKSMFREDRYKNALVWLMADTYASMTHEERKWNGKLTEPACVTEETKQWTAVTDVATLLEERYVITNNPKDTEVSSRELIEYLEKKGVVMSPQKLALEIGKLISLPPGCTLQKDVSRGGAKYRRGIRLRSEADDEDF